MKFSCVIINMNGERWLKGLLSSLRLALKETQTQDFDVTLVDNGSTDESLNIYLSTCGNDPRYRMLHYSTNLGWARAVNVGLGASGGDYVFVISNDLEMHPDSLKNALAILDNDQTIGVLQFNSISIHDRSSTDSGCCYIDALGFIYGYSCRSKVDFVSFAEGVCFAIRRAILKKVGSFDETYFMMYEDVDFSWRAWLAGYKVASARESIVYHFRGGIIGQNFRNFKNMYIRNTARNHLITLLKNYEPLNAFLSYPMAALLILVESAYVFVRIDRRKGLAGIMGVLESFWRIPNTIASRVTIQENRQICDRELMHVMHRFSPAFLMSNSILLAENGRRNLPKTEVDLRFDDE